MCLPISLAAAPPVLSEKLTDEQIAQARADYTKTTKALETYRTEQLKIYNKARTKAEKVKVLEETRTRLQADLNDKIFPAWDGTTWAFHGISTKPGEGEIACGYFVSTCLKQMGFNINRIKLAQQASQRIIKTFVPRKKMSISSGKSMEQITEYLKTTGNGTYIVGLDTHVGFVTVEGDEMRFVHSSYYSPERQVKSELIDGKNPLADSKYRVFGKIFADDMIEKWLKNEPFPVAK